MTDGGLVLITGGDDPMSGGVSAGLKFRSGEGCADSMEVLTWSSGFCTDGEGDTCCGGGSWGSSVKESRRRELWGA